MIDLQPYRDAMERATSDQELKQIYDELFIASRSVFYQTDTLHNYDYQDLRNSIVNLNRELNKRYQKEWKVGDRVGSHYFESGTIEKFEYGGYVRIKDDETGKNYLVIPRIDLHPLEEKIKLEEEQPNIEREQLTLF